MRSASSALEKCTSWTPWQNPSLCAACNAQGVLVPVPVGAGAGAAVSAVACVSASCCISDLSCVHPTRSFSWRETSLEPNIRSR